MSLTAMDGGWTREVHAHRTAVKAEEARLRHRLQRKGLCLDSDSSNAGLTPSPPPPPPFESPNLYCRLVLWFTCAGILGTVG